MNINNKKIIIFGGTGTLGRALIKRYNKNNNLILFSRDEAKHWTIKNQIPNSENLSFVIGDIRDYIRVQETVVKYNPDIIIIASALKQVDTCENSPYESIQTNIIGIQNIVQAVKSNVNILSKLDTVLLVSTDKACAPSNVYGMCKAIAERIVTSVYLELKKPKFVAVRYGNVLESRGSIIPLFKHQAEHEEFLTVTHSQMTRFIMTLDESINLIESTIIGSKTGEIWLPQLKSMKIMDLAEIFSEKFSKPIKILGIRPGEKFDEDLISLPESLRVIKKEKIYRMLPAHTDQINDKNSFFYSSNQDLITKDDLRDYLEKIGIFNKSMVDFIGREIEEIKTSN